MRREGSGEETRGEPRTTRSQREVVRDVMLLAAIYDVWMSLKSWRTKRAIRRQASRRNAALAETAIRRIRRRCLLGSEPRSAGSAGREARSASAELGSLLEVTEDLGVLGTEQQSH
jgi:hypothetical protein